MADKLDRDQTLDILRRAEEFLTGVEGTLVDAALVDLFHGTAHFIQDLPVQAQEEVARRAGLARAVAEAVLEEA